MLRGSVRLLVVLWLVMLYLLTGRRIAVWQTDDTLWADGLVKTPLRARAWINYGQVLEDQDHLAMAIQCYRRAVWVLSQRPDHHVETERVIALADLAHALARVGQFEEADRILQRLTRTYRYAEVVNRAYARLKLEQGECWPGVGSTNRSPRWVCPTVPYD